MPEDLDFQNTGFRPEMKGFTPPASAYTNGVVTPHAAFLALRWAPQATLSNLAALEADFDIYGK